MIGTISWAGDPGLFKKAGWEEEGKTGRVSNSFSFLVPASTSLNDG